MTVAVLLHALLSGAAHSFRQDYYPDLGEYGQYIAPIAKGATGDVLLFQHNKSMTRYAVKAFVRNTASNYDDEYDRSIKEEYSFAQSLRHAHVVETYDLTFDSASHQWYMVMQYCPGLLSRRIKAAFSEQISLPGTNQEQLETHHVEPTPPMTCLFHQLLQGLGYMHEMGIVHCDLKPNNVGIDDHGRVRVLDFGISFQTQDRLTGEKHLLWGKFCFSSPTSITIEQAQSGQCRDLTVGKSPILGASGSG